MALPKTPFTKAVGGLKSPTASLYEQSLWDGAFKLLGSTIEDRNLYEAARWIAIECEAARSLLASPELELLNVRWSTMVAVASLNKEYRVAVELTREKAQERLDAGKQSFDPFTDIRIDGPLGQTFTLANISEHAIDATENWLFDGNLSTAVGVPSGDLSRSAGLATRRYSFRKLMNTIWNEILLSGWKMTKKTDGTSVWGPADRARAALEHAWLRRQEANLGNYVNIDRTVWPKLPNQRRRKLGRTLGVTEVESRDGHIQVKVGILQYRSKNLPDYVAEKSALEGCYLADFLDTDMPSYPGLSISKLLLAWHICYDIARLRSRQVALPTTLDADRVRDLSLAVGKATLTRAIEKGLQIDAELATSIVKFLTFSFQTGGTNKDKGNKGLWMAPLVKVRTEEEYDEFLLPLPVLATSNVARRAEAWLEKGGVDDSNPLASRGDRYEKIIRDRITKALRSNRKLVGVALAADGIPTTSGFKEQVDLLVSFGGICIVGEIKLFLMPADAQERERYDRKLSAAADQVKRKVGALRARPDVLASSLGLPQTEVAALELVPLVLTAQNYGFSTTVNEVLVVEAEFLRLYLSGGSIVVNRAMSLSTGESADQSIEYYQTEREAALKLRETIRQTYVLRRFLDRIRWVDAPLPTLVSPGAELVTPFMSEPTGYDRFVMQGLLSGIKNS